MNRRSVITLSAIMALGLAMLPSSIVAQQGTLRQQLVGSWTLVTEEMTAQNGTKEQPYGPNPRGILILDAGGRYATVRARPDRPKFKSSSQPTADELVAAMRSEPTLARGQSARRTRPSPCTWRVL